VGRVHRVQERDVILRWKAFYGAHPVHLLVLLCCLALAGYAALGVLVDPAWPRILFWFLAAIVAHDLVVFPLCAAIDRALTRARPGPAINYLRVPLLGVGLTFLLFFPGIVRQGAISYQVATGLTQQPFLARWLLLCAALFAASLLVYLIRAGTARLRHHPHPPRESAPSAH
jgi:hypothetical protein